MKLQRIAIIFSSLFAFLAIAIGAFGAHALQESLTAYELKILQTATHYQFIHAIALLALASLTAKLPLRFPIYAMIVGTIIFSGSLYLIIISNHSFFGAITPLGGVSLLAAWARLFFIALKKDQRSE